MYKIGVIVNPDAGRDIRRLSAFAEYMDSNRKTLLATQFICALYTLCKDIEFYIMPDINYTDEKIRKNLHLINMPGEKIIKLNIDQNNNEEDTIKAAKKLEELQVDFVFICGGDGTNRLVFETADKLILLPLSTGTNNAFPFRLNPTSMALAAYYYLKNNIPPVRRKALEVNSNGSLYYALVDVAVLDTRILGSKAILELEDLKELFLTVACLENIGLSAIGAEYGRIDFYNKVGYHVLFNNGKNKVFIPFAPGIIKEASIKSISKIKFDKKITVNMKDCVIALDGERMLEVKDHTELYITLIEKGPFVIDAPDILKNKISI